MRLQLTSRRPENADYTINRMLLGTHTSGKGTDQLMIAEVMLPKTATETAGKDTTELYDEERQGKSSSIENIFLRRG
jgi:hypothetical protein